MNTAERFMNAMNVMSKEELKEVYEPSIDKIFDVSALNATYAQFNDGAALYVITFGIEKHIFCGNNPVEVFIQIVNFASENLRWWEQCTNCVMALIQAGAITEDSVMEVSGLTPEQIEEVKSE